MKPGPEVSPSNPRVDTQREAEAALLERCRAGDTRAFEALVEGHQDRAYALALRIVRSGPDAEEVAQDAFVKAWLSIREFRGESGFGTWLHRIVVRRALDRAESLRARGAREERLDSDREVGTGAAASEPQPSASRSPGIERLMDTLSPLQRAALTLHYYEDRSVSEIALLLDLPEGTVKTHMNRGRAALRLAWTRAERAERKP
jgi:RNA polymerase sigma-70 factor (ECF subfamily)